MSDIERKAEELYRARQMDDMSISITFGSEDYVDYIRTGVMDYDRFVERGKDALYDAVCEIISEHKQLIKVISDLLPDNEIERLDRKTRGLVKCFRSYEGADALADKLEEESHKNGEFIKMFKHEDMCLYHEDGYLNDGFACIELPNTTQIVEENGLVPTFLERLREPANVKDLLSELWKESKERKFPQIWTEISFKIDDEDVSMDCDLTVVLDELDVGGLSLKAFGFDRETDTYAEAFDNAPPQKVCVYKKSYEELPLTLEEREYILAQYAETVIDILPPASRDAIRCGFPNIPKPMQSKTDKEREDL